VPIETVTKLSIDRNAFEDGRHRGYTAIVNKDNANPSLRDELTTPALDAACRRSGPLTTP
jgi:hypothetical protein